MARPDLSAERTEQILDAFERSVIKHGIEASSLEKVAQEAGVKRPIIRHYIGNREQLILALAERVVGRFKLEAYTMIEDLGDTDRLEKLILKLTTEHRDDVADSVLIYENLVHVGMQLEPIRVMIASWTEEFISIIENELRADYPNASGHHEVACGLVAIHYNHVSLKGLQLKPSIEKGAELAARRLVASLDV